MKILLVEDNAHLLERVKKQLDKLYVVDIARTGHEAVEKGTYAGYGVILLDLGLPDISGLTVCKRLRDKGVETPILILTGMDDMTTRVDLLNHGADDYVTKPFDNRELKARVAALSRRSPLRYKKSPVITYKDLVIDPNKREVYRQGVGIPLRRKEFDILEYLVNNNGRVLTREMIINHAWDSNKTSWNSTVDVHIKHLRDKIDRPFNSSLIKTAYGLGYRVDVAE
jgi:DNA-binding response OmpR family regulator